MVESGVARSIDTVVLDLGGVLIDWSPRYAYGSIESKTRSLDTFLGTVATTEWNSTLDEGNSFDLAIEERIRLFPEWSDWLRNWKLEWPSMLRGPIQPTLQIVTDLLEARSAGRLKGLFALSNWAASTFCIAQARFPFLGEFDGVLISGQERVAKPDPKFFQLLQTRFGVVPESALFVDDVEKNIRSALTLGYQTYHFGPSAESAALGLRQKLVASGILETK